MDLFDWKFYLDKYPDLRINGVHTEEDAIYHWKTRGKSEGRKCYNTPCFNLDYFTSLPKYIFADHGIDTKTYSGANINDVNIQSILSPYVNNHFCLGHDLHISRIIVFDLLNKNIINNNDTLIVTKDRQVFYNNLFKNIITFTEFIEKVNNNEIHINNFIFLPSVVNDLLYGRPNTELMKFNYNINNNDYWNDKMIENITTFNKCIFNNELNNIIKNKFIIFIIRSFDNIDIDSTYHNYIYNLRQHTLTKYKLILYCYKDIQFNKEHYDYIINNISEYMSLLIHTNCYFVIGEMSGLLEVSYFHHNNNLQILEFVNITYKKPLDYNLCNNTFKHSIMSNWNNKYIEPITHKLFENFKNILETIEF
jgi:hypothetical protein